MTNERAIRRLTSERRRRSPSHSLVLLRAVAGVPAVVGTLERGWAVGEGSLGEPPRLRVALGAPYTDGVTTFTESHLRAGIVVAFGGLQYSVRARARAEEERERVAEYDLQPTSNPWPPPEPEEP